MFVSVFAKKSEKDGRTYYRYIGKTNKKNGEEATFGVKFKDPCVGPRPDECPCNIEVQKENANMATRTYTDEKTGEIRVAYTLWVRDYELSEVPWVDHSLDDFD